MHWPSDVGDGVACNYPPRARSNCAPQPDRINARHSMFENRSHQRPRWNEEDESGHSQLSPKLGHRRTQLSFPNRDKRLGPTCQYVDSLDEQGIREGSSRQDVLPRRLIRRDLHRVLGTEPGDHRDANRSNMRRQFRAAHSEHAEAPSGPGDPAITVVGGAQPRRGADCLAGERGGGVSDRTARFVVSVGSTSGLGAACSAASAGGRGGSDPRRAVCHR